MLKSQYIKWAKELFYPANLISISRMVCIFPFYYAFKGNNFTLASILLIYIVISDVLDGYVARKLRQVSEIGKGLDPLADKIAMGIGIFVILKRVHFGFIPFYIMILRDVILITLGAIAIERKQPITGSDIFGKLSTIFLSLGITVIFFYIVFHNIILFTIGKWLYYIGTFILLITCYRYARISATLLKLAFSPERNKNRS